MMTLQVIDVMKVIMILTLFLYMNIQSKVSDIKDIRKYDRYRHDERIEVMNESWKYSTKISFSTSRKIEINSCMSWHKWADITLTNEVVKVYMLI